jgi:hypothetical protein
MRKLLCERLRATGALPGWLVALLTVPLLACSSAGPGAAHTGTPGSPGTDAPEEEACAAAAPEGMDCEVSAECPEAHQVCVSGHCVAPENPEVSCDPIEGDECPAGQLCVSRVCVVVPTTCQFSYECPAGHLCQQGSCVADGSAASCPGAGAAPQLAGDWTVRSTLDMRKGLGGLADGVLDVASGMSDLLDGKLDLGLPVYAEILLGAYVAEVVKGALPQWAEELVRALAGLSQALEKVYVDARVTLTRQCRDRYRGSTTWERLEFDFGGRRVSGDPASMGLNDLAPEEFTATYQCGKLHIDRHRIRHRLEDAVRWLIDQLVSDLTGYARLDDALGALIDCPRIVQEVDREWQRSCACNGSLALFTGAACSALKGQILAQVRAAIAVSSEESLLGLRGVATVRSGERMDDGVWFGTLLSFEFPGTFDARRRQ